MHEHGNWTCSSSVRYFMIHLRAWMVLHESMRWEVYTNLGPLESSPWSRHGGWTGWGADHRPQIAPICKCFSWVNADERLELRNQHVCNFCMLLPEWKNSANLLGTRARWGVLEAVPHLPRKSVGILEAPCSEGTSRTWRLWWPRVLQESWEVPESFFGAELWAPIFHIAFKKMEQPWSITDNYHSFPMFPSHMKVQTRKNLKFPAPGSETPPADIEAPLSASTWDDYKPMSWNIRALQPIS